MESATLASWVAAVGTVLAFLAVTVQIVRESVLRRRELVTAQAQRISAWINFSQDGSEATILNASDEPAYRVIITTVIVRSGKPEDARQYVDGGEAGGYGWSRYLSVLPPGRSYVELPDDYHGMGRKPGVEIGFVDRAGRFWVRDGVGKLKHIRKDPAQYYGLSEPLSWEFPESGLHGSRARTIKHPELTTEIQDRVRDLE